MKRKFGDQSSCRKCRQDIEWTGRKSGWRDRGNNRECVTDIRNGEIVKPKPGQIHGPVRKKDWLG